MRYKAGHSLVSGFLNVFEIFFEMVFKMVFYI